MSNPTIWVVTPVYFDTASFVRLRDRVSSILSDVASPRCVQRFVVVDDSAGADPEIQRVQRDDTTVVEAPFNLGHQRALVFVLRLAAAQIADTDIVITLDADGEDRPEDLPRLLDPILQHPQDRHRIALARRTRRQETLRFKVFYFLFKILFRSLTGQVIRSGNYAAYRGWTARNVLFHPSFDLCYSSTFVSLRLPIDFVPCERGKRYEGSSHMGFWQLALHGARMLMPFMDRVAVRALIAFSGLFVVGAGVGVSLLVVGTLSKTAIPPWLLTVVIVLLVASVTCLGNFVVLFTVFAQSRGLSLSNLEQGHHAFARDRTQQASIANEV